MKRERPRNEYDHLNISGSANLGGMLDVVLANGYEPALGDTFDLFDGTLNGAFAAVNLPALESGLQWDQSHLYGSGILAVTVVPEPSTLVLLSAGAALMVCAWRRRRSSRSTARASK